MEHRGRLACETLLWDIIEEGTYHTFDKTHRVYNAKNELGCKLWALVNNNMPLVTHPLQQTHYSNPKC